MREPCTHATCRAIVVALVAQQLRSVEPVLRAQLVAEALELARTVKVESREAQIVAEQIG